MTQLIDAFGRQINYLRISLTDRCNFRCTYCMPEQMQFEPRQEQLASTELLMIARAFTELGVSKIRLTGGEPTIHPDFDFLLAALSGIDALQTIALTTNGSTLIQKAAAIKQSKVQQLNISLDSLQADNFKRITRCGDLSAVLSGISRASELDVKRIRLNVVVSAGVNDHELDDLLDFAIKQNIHIAFIEEMPLGSMPNYSRSAHFLSNQQVKEHFVARYTLLPMLEKRVQSGPAEYYKIAGSSTELGFISPHSNNFCSSCNRVRLTRKGELILCLGQESSVDLRAVIRAHTDEQEQLVQLKQTIIAAMAAKPESHQFDHSSDDVQVVRFMNVTGG